MRIDRLTIREIQLRLKAPFETSFGTTQNRRILLVEVQSGELCGWGEITALESPFYTSETVDTSWMIFCKYLRPLALGKDLDISSVASSLKPIRGYEMTKAAMENALWDIEAQEQGISLAKLLGGTRHEIPCGVSLGIHEQVEDLLGAIDQELAAGYQRIKIKIKPGKDIEIIASVRKRFPDIELMVDANSAYRLEDAFLLKEFDAYKLMMIEQPLDWDEIFEHSLLQRHLRTPICLDECIHNLKHARAAIELGACGVINIKLGRVGGHGEARKIEEMCRTKSVPVWCGGMLESGVGRAHNIAMSTLPGFVLPGDVSASQRYWDEDIIEPEVTVNLQGMIRVPTTPGLGYEIRRRRIEQLTVREETCWADGSSLR